jgi:diguanylate cyclase (GGDEF)-like protein
MIRGERSPHLREREFPLPPNEAARQAALERYQVLDTSPERFYDDAATLAAAICGTPIAMVSLIDNERQWYKSKVGIDLTETHRRDAFCAHAIMTPDMPLIVKDAWVDERFKDSALVTANPNIRFYAGAPLVTPEGQALGTLCVIDTIPRDITAAQLTALEALSRTVASHLEQGRHIADLERLMLAKDAHVEELQEYTQALEEASSRYREESLIDPVTNGPNRRACEIRLEEEHQRALRYGASYALLTIDVDNFKDVNDLHGHSRGDAVLAMASKLLRKCLRPNDFVGRLGGDEFVAILPRTNARGAQVLAERMRRTIYNASWETAFPVTISVGIACWNGADDTAALVLARSDEAMYLAKSAGRNAVSGPHSTLL